VAYMRSLETEAGKRGDVTQQEDEKRRAWYQIAHGGRAAQALVNRTIQVVRVQHALSQPAECRKCRATCKNSLYGQRTIGKSSKTASSRINTYRICSVLCESKRLLRCQRLDSFAIWSGVILTMKLPMKVCCRWRVMRFARVLSLPNTSAVFVTIDVTETADAMMNSTCTRIDNATDAQSLARALTMPQARRPKARRLASHQIGDDEVGHPILRAIRHDLAEKERIAVDIPGLQ
jgi:hypothetical protein